MQKPPEYFCKAQLRSRGAPTNPSLICSGSKNDNPLAKNGHPDDQILPLALPGDRTSAKNDECIAQNTYFPKPDGMQEKKTTDSKRPSCTPPGQDLNFQVLADWLQGTPAWAPRIVI